MPPRSEQDFLALWRGIALATTTVLIVFTVIVDNLGRLLLDATFHVSEVIFATLVASWTTLLGLEGIRRLRNGGSS